MATATAHLARNNTSIGTNALNRLPFWNPQIGSSTIRILPYQHNGNGNPFVEVYLHWGIDNETVASDGSKIRTPIVSPITFGEVDPYDKLGKSWAWDSPLRKRYKTYPTLRVFVPIVHRNDDGTADLTRGVQYWGFGKAIFETLLSHMADPDWGIISDPYEGKDIVVTKTDRGGRYGDTSIRVKPKVTPLGTPEEVSKLLTGHRDVHAFYRHFLESSDRAFLEHQARRVQLEIGCPSRTNQR